MTNLRPFRFAVQIHGASSRQEWIEKVCKAEDLGFSSILFGDHLMNAFAPLTALAVAASATRTLRIDINVLGNDFRNPVMLAHEAATLDVLSEGRFELGLGTGWYIEDYQKSGIFLDPPAVRVSRFEEAIHIIKGFFSGESFSFDGRYYQVKDLKGQPRPVQKPHPPFILGGGGKRMLSIAAREADIVSINVLTTRDGWLDVSTLTAEATLQKVAWIRQAAGSRFDNLELSNLIVHTEVTDDRRQAAANLLQSWQIPEDILSLEQVLASPAFLIGSVDQMIEELQMRREKYGLSYFSLYEPLEPIARVVASLSGT